ncbi:hypothetical protein [Thalassoglobus polymorphus]|uniref:Uncharacterized protein n=1 Tax=Thalassoglobus polymorphus TaxID=2527994 RepID=A0A517QPU4_9PLAN|nr:hypothetical protein [Thalassoglobus polymorphus]QDT33632.1 hypothetical protein Mal48_28860 [Thalassoglobus polymorphus]
MNISDLTASLQKYWSVNGPEGVPTLFSGATLDVSQKVRWMEFWIGQFKEKPRRPDAPVQFELLVDVHLFSRERNKRSINELADSVRNTFQSASIPILASTSSETDVGKIRLSEPIVRDFSRPETVGGVNTMQHLLISYHAHAIGLSE